MAQKKKREKAWKKNRKGAGGASARGPRRECGECTACCRAPEIPWLEKPPFTACEHLEEGVGCGIYAARPDGCRKFKCLWLAAPKDMSFLTEDDRPDKIGVMIASASQPGEHPGVDLWELRPGALESERASRIRAEIRARKYTITETRQDPETGDVKWKLATPTIDGKPVFIKHAKWGDRDNATFLFGQ